MIILDKSMKKISSGIRAIALETYSYTSLDLFSESNHACIVCLFDLILYVPSTIFQLNRDGSSWVEPVLS